MARNRLQQSGVPQSYGDQSAPGGNPYSNPYADPQESAPLASNPYAQAGGGYTGYPPNSQGGYNNTAYGQQDQYDAGGRGAVGNGTGGGGANAFFNQLSGVNSTLDQLQRSIQDVRTAHSQTLNSTDPRAVQQADGVLAQSRQLRQQAQAEIKALFQASKGNKQYRTQADAASKRFQGLINEHQVVEKEYRDRTKEKAARQYKIVKPDASQAEIDEVVNSDNPQVFATALLNSGRYSEARGAYKEVQDRHTEILKVEKTMTELAQMFQEMAMLVEQQDEQITQVEQNAYQVNTDVERGNQELTQAVTKAKAARRKKWICFWITIVIIIIIALAVGIPLGLQASNNNK